jgi:MYXO-CTERM domain-containing protein
MIARPTRWIASAIFLALAVGTALALVQQPSLGTLSVTTGQVGAPFSATIQATGGTAPYTYSITAGALPGGLDFNPKTATSGAMTISGTPQAAGTYNFTVTVSDSTLIGFRGQDSQAAARPRGLAQSGNHAVDASGNFTITIAPGAVGAAGAPTSPWTLAMVMVGLAGAGFWRLRRTRRA